MNKLLYPLTCLLLLLTFSFFNNSNIVKNDNYQNQEVMKLSSNHDENNNYPIIYTSDIETHPNRKIHINEILKNIIAYDTKNKSFFSDITIIDVDNYKDKFSIVGLYRFQVNIKYDTDKKASTFLNIKVLNRSDINLNSNHNLTTGNKELSEDDIFQLLKSENFKYFNDIKSIEYVNNKKYICVFNDTSYIELYTQLNCLNTDNYIHIEEIQGAIVRFLNIFSIVLNLDNNYQQKCNFLGWFSNFTIRWNKAISIFEQKEIYRYKF